MAFRTVQRATSSTMLSKALGSLAVVNINGTTVTTPDEGTTTVNTGGYGGYYGYPGCECSPFSPIPCSAVRAHMQELLLGARNVRSQARAGGGETAGTERWRGMALQWSRQRRRSCCWGRGRTWRQSVGSDAGAGWTRVNGLWAETASFRPFLAGERGLGCDIGNRLESNDCDHVQTTALAMPLLAAAMAATRTPVPPLPQPLPDLCC